MPDRPPPNLYLIRIRNRKRGAESEPQICRGQIKNLGTGEERNFQGWSALIDHLIAMDLNAQYLNQDSSTYPPARKDAQ